MTPDAAVVAVSVAGVAAMSSLWLPSAAVTTTVAAVSSLSTAVE